jgi:hypothetical protein
MRRRCFHGLLAGILVVAGSSLAWAQANDPQYGTWKLNLAKSKYSPGPAPKEGTVTIEAAGPGRKVTVNGVAADGTAVKWGYSGNFDGKEIRLTGNNPDADVVILKRISANAVRTTNKMAGKRTLVNGVNAKGQTVKNTQVFDKQ